MKIALKIYFVVSLILVLSACSGSENFQITPVRPVYELILESSNAIPPVEKGSFKNEELVEIVKLDSTIRLDIRYATKNNFLSTPMYSQPRAFLQRPAAEAVVRVQNALKSKGYGLIVYDAYRPWYITKVFWDATPANQHEFVADPANGSRHNRGCAIDLSLVELSNGNPVTMPSEYDEMSERANANYKGGTDKERRLRDLLRSAMEKEGFNVLDVEWWHFDYKDWKFYSIQNVRFENIQSKIR